jgi:hypothetical protein
MRAASTIAPILEATDIQAMLAVQADSNSRYCSRQRRFQRGNIASVDYGRTQLAEHHCQPWPQRDPMAGPLLEFDEAHIVADDPRSEATDFGQCDRRRAGSARAAAG